MEYLHFFSAFRETLIAVAVGGGYAALFFVLFFEALPLIGIALPGHVVVISGGFLASTGVMDFFWVCMLSIAGAVLGDYMSFLLGRRFGWRLIEKLRPYFFISESAIKKTRSFLDNHKGKALFMGRFNPVTRGLMPFFMGANMMHHKHFWLWNTFGALCWVMASILGGYALGIGYGVVAGWTSKALVLSVIAIMLIVWGYRFVNMRFHVFRRYELFVLGMNLLSILILFRMVEDAYSAQPFMAAFDLYINGLVNDYVASGHQLFIEMASWINALGGTVMLALFTVIGAFVLGSHKKWRSMAVLLLGMGSTAFFTGWLKDFILRVRPENFITVVVPDWLRFIFDGADLILEPSFPSAHASFAAAFFTIVAYLAIPRTKSWVKRELLIVIAVILAIAVGISRVIVSAHWASDVIAGWALGIFCATSSILLVRYVGTLIMGKLPPQIGPDWLTEIVQKSKE